MKITSAKLACFSPTGTSRAIVQAISEGLSINDFELVDMTKPEVRQKKLQTTNNELLVVAMPVYSGRLPVLAENWLNDISLSGTPTICVAVYGNREYDDALLELQDLVKKQGGVPLACAAFIGEHSFSAEGTPIAVSRPDKQDLEKACAFGTAVQKVIDSFEQNLEIPEIAVPGNRPYKERSKGAPLDFIEIGENCTECGVCASVCPTGAISKALPTETDLAKCIRCCACIKACPVHARSMKEGAMMDIARKLSSMCAERKEPVTFFPN